jgi:serine/threonine protein kinase/tetratricopeptide (TPR) repeat protein
MGLSAGTRLGPYEIVAPLGAGGMGEVYRARDTRLSRDVAVKVVHPGLASDPDRLARFEKEARAAAQLDHPNILVVHDVGTHEGSPFIVSELLQGESLREKLGSPLPPKKAVDYAVQIAHGLAAAHEKGIVHRDVKPENVFVTKDGHVKILDFGVAKLLPSFEASGVDTETPTASATQPGTAVGTVAYMSPEQIRGLPVDARSDLFSLGVVLYEMLSGKRPFQRETAAEIMTAILREEPPDLSETNRSVPAALENVVRHCLEKEPESRFQSARDVVFALEALPEVSTARPAAPMSPTGVWLHRHRTSLAGAALLVVGLAVAGTLIFASRKHSAASSGLPSVLALPCTVYGAPEVSFLTDAVPGTISTLLSQVEGLDTKVPPTSYEAEKVKGDLSKLAELYQVSSFIVTSITTSPGRFALNVQLVDAASRKVRWGKQYEGPRETYNDLARQAAEGIRLAVRPAASPVPTTGVSSAAELALREGDHFWNRYLNLHHPEDFDAGLAAYQRALKEDPSLANAAVGVGGMYAQRLHFEGEASGARKEWEAWTRRALEIDRRCGRAWAHLSAMEWYAKKPDLERQLEYALRAASFSPNDAFSHQAVSIAVVSPGALSLQLAAALRAMNVDPFYLPASGNVALDLIGLGRSEEALLVIDRAMRVEPDAWVGNVRAAVLLSVGRLDEARKTLARGEPQFLEHPSAPLNQWWGQIRFRLAVAERDAATIEKLERYILPPLLDGEATPIARGGGVGLVSPALALLGRTDESIRILLRNVEAGIPPPYDFLLNLLNEPGFQPLKSDPRFARVLAASRDGAAKIARILGEARSRGELPKYLEAPLNDLVKLLNEKGAKRHP